MDIIDKNTIRLVFNDIKKETQYKLAFLLITIFTFYISLDVSKSIALDISNTEFMLYSISNHYFIIYGYFLFLMFWINIDIKSVSSLEYIRMKNKKQINIIKLLSSMIKIAIIIILFNIISLCIGSKNLLCANLFTNTILNDNYYSIFKCFNNPITATFISSLFLWLGSIFIYQILYFVKFKTSKVIYIMIYTFLILNTMIGFNTNLDNGIFSLLFLNNYFILHHSLFIAGLTNFITINLIIFIVIHKVFMVNNYLKPNNKYLISILNNNFVISAIFLFVILFTIYYNSYINNYSLVEYTFINIKGYSSLSFNLIEFLTHTIIIIYPLFILNIFWEREHIVSNTYIIIRYNNKIKYNRLIEKISIIFILKYVAVYFTIFIFFSYLANINFNNHGNNDFINLISNYYSIDNLTLFNIFLFCMILKPVEIYFLYLFNRLTLKITKNTTFSYLVTISGYLLSLFINNFNSPFGISSMYRLLEYKNISFITYSYPIIISIIILYIFNKQIK